MSHIELVDALSPDATTALETSLRDYNRDRNPDFWHARELPANAARPLNVCARNADGYAIGALTGETQFKWLRVSLMSVEHSARRQGIGAGMMQLAEAEANRRGCQYAYVDTMDYQARDFYERLGYTVAGQLDDWDSHGHAKLFLVKRLSASQPE
ncbi:MAG TPA: GNAT family N-acetyltransferase [Lacipirellulaceae bacterium]|jgi:GNAT superfamily N-acetyltransferase|nr:GNAT family N-acetyltransferase [Lacipirellulaceae bacterium]